MYGDCTTFLVFFRLEASRGMGILISSGLMVKQPTYYKKDDGNLGEGLSTWAVVNHFAPLRVTEDRFTREHLEFRPQYLLDILSVRGVRFDFQDILHFVSPWFSWYLSFNGSSNPTGSYIFVPLRNQTLVLCLAYFPYHSSAPNTTWTVASL